MCVRKERVDYSKTNKALLSIELVIKNLSDSWIVRGNVWTDRNRCPSSSSHRLQSKVSERNGGDVNRLRDRSSDIDRQGKGGGGRCR